MNDTSTEAYARQSSFTVMS